MYQVQDTIAAIATPSGIGGIGIVRVSGDKAFSIAEKILISSHSLDRRREIILGKFQDPRTREILDEGILLVMPKPHSYTSEDVIEFHVHGSPSVLEKLIEILVSLGVRPAEAGEFTYRAFLNGRLDLTQAEAVEALISAQGDAARRQALRQLTGGLTAHLEPLEEALKTLYLKIEARLEFSEDGIPSLDQGKFQTEILSVQNNLQRLLESYQQGKVIREGLTVALVGPPNVGKSSLLNALLGTQRAIVASTPGTTRDVVEGEIRLKGVRVRLFDTAGIREAHNEVEVEGISRSHQVIGEADLVFWLVDASNPNESLQVIKSTSLPYERIRYLFNKVDLIEGREPWKGLDLPTDKCFGLSCKTQEGIQTVVDRIEEWIKTPAVENVVITSTRHQQEIQKASQALENLHKLMESGQTFDLWAEELREAALAIGHVRGRNLPASAFEEIFTRFCIGK